MKPDVQNSIMEIIRSCDAVHLCTCGGEYPDARHLTNALNRDADNIVLYFITGRTTPKYAQLRANPKCCLYYFNDVNHHSVRLFGDIEFIDDMGIRRKYWRDEYKKFGYDGPESTDFILMRFTPVKYKFYIGPTLHTGNITE